MKSLALFTFLLMFSFSSIAQDYYWVYFTDKNAVEFNPYEYFDQKTISKRENINVPLNDISDYPLNENYVNTVSNLSAEYIGETRWFNAIAVFANDDDIVKISELEFVAKIEKIVAGPIICEYDFFDDTYNDFERVYQDGILPQLRAMEGEEFVNNNIEGQGIRIAVFDGGFPDVDTHDAFTHLRENQQIKATYNFPKKQENVYGWNSHGTMVLSCIAGIDRDGNKMGLATKSEFILARTEINSEPAREEVYWLMAVEWADKNGADVINSSLGYGADRHNPVGMDGKTCLVSRAANMAAAKGMLVCNAMGNEGDQNSWKTLGAPADVDSILSIGGIEPEFGYHISFSSFGPTADGRMKPNVSAFGKANVAKPNDGYGAAYGTSFASPLVAGFVACAWQTNRELSAMELKSEIEKSGNLYPYYDYAVGFGVPQAGYFTGKKHDKKDKIFEITKDDDDVIISVSDRELYQNILLYYHIESKNTQLEYYSINEFWMSSGDEIRIKHEALQGGKTLRVYCRGYVEEYKLAETDNLVETEKSYYSLINKSGQTSYYNKDVARDKPSAFGVNSKFYILPYLSFGLAIPPDSDVMDIQYGKSRNWQFGLKYIHNVSKWYRVGLSVDYSKSKYFYDIVLNAPDPSIDEIEAFVQLGRMNFEFFQRFRLIPGTSTGFGTYLDLGVYGNMVLKYTDKQTTTFLSDDVTEEYTYWNNYNKFNYGVQVKLGYGVLALYAKYRFTDVFGVINAYGSPPPLMNFPEIEAGIELNLPLIMN
ncbi:MAG: S8 family serine peptidase [Bacteroidales bacterium]|nr:S8 family serine peptidase [Bacteroidales bacterium]